MLQQNTKKRKYCNGNKGFLLFAILIFIALDSLGQKEIIIRDKARISSKRQKMVSGVNTILKPGTESVYIATYIADDKNSQEYYGKSENVYIAIQEIDIKHPQDVQRYKRVLRKGQNIGGHILTTIPYNPMIAENNGTVALIFEGSLDGKSRGLISVNLYNKGKQITKLRSIDYLKVKIRDRIVSLSPESYLDIVSSHGYKTIRPGCFVADLNPFKDKNHVYHLAVGCAPDNYILILKSKDLKIWEYERILSLKGNETDLCYNHNVLHYVVRSGNDIYYGENNQRNMKIARSIASRPRFILKDSCLFLLCNVAGESKKDHLRSTVSFRKCLPTGMEELYRLKKKESIQYYDVITYKDMDYLVYSTDNESNVGFSKGELQIMQLPFVLK